MALVEQFEKEFFKRPILPSSSQEDPEQWVRLLFWQERYSDWLETKIRSKCKEAYIDGYERGHFDTVESCYGSSEEKADEWLSEHFE